MSEVRSIHLLQVAGAFALLAALSGAGFAALTAPLIAQQHSGRLVEGSPAQAASGESVSDTLTKDEFLEALYSTSKSPQTYPDAYDTVYGDAIDFSDARSADFEYLTSTLSEVDEVNARLISSDTKGITVVPEPSSVVLMGAGLAALSVLRRRFRRT
ncbi:MAG: hypothetical protein AMXMBFR4_25880 [Candidatus Hydrogenedentota bacterium]